MVVRGVRSSLCAESRVSEEGFDATLPISTAVDFAPSCIAQLQGYQLVTRFTNYEVLPSPRNLLF